VIDPEKVTNYKQTKEQLEEFLLFWICAAGKNGRTAARCLDKFLVVTGGYEIGPFISILGWIASAKAQGMPDHFYIAKFMKDSGIGCFNIKSKAFGELAASKLNLKTCTVTDLESIYGIGPKTARCFLLHSRKDAQVAGLDTHMLKYLREMGYDDAPKSTPTGKKYLTNEKRVLSLAKEAGMTPASFDLMVWNKYSVKRKLVKDSRGLHGRL